MFRARKRAGGDLGLARGAAVDHRIDGIESKRLEHMRGQQRIVAGARRGLRRRQRLRPFEQLIERLHAGLRDRRNGADHQPDEIVANAEIIHARQAGLLQQQAAAEHVVLGFARRLARRDGGIDRGAAGCRRVEHLASERRIAREIDEEIPEQQCRPLDQIAGLRIGDAEVIGDDRGRHRQGQLLRHVDAARLPDAGAARPARAPAARTMVATSSRRIARRMLETSRV